MSARATGAGAAAAGASQSPTDGIEVPGREARAPDVAFDIEEDLWRAAALNDLATWVGRAVHFVARVHQASLVSDHTDAWLHANGIEVPEWLDHHAHGLVALHHEVDEHLRAVRQIVGLEFHGTAAAPDVDGTAAPRVAGVVV